MKKFLFWLFVVIVVIVISAYFWLGMIVKTGVEKFVPPIVGVSVTLDKVDISLFDGEFKVKRLVVANPSGFGTAPAFSVDEIKVELEMTSLFHKTIIVDEVEIKRPMASIIVNENGMNLDVIHRNIQKYLSNSTTESQAKGMPDKGKVESSKNVIIRKIKFDDGELYLGAFGVSQMIRLPDIEMKNIGEGNRKTLGQGIAEVLSFFTSQALQEYAKAGVQMGKQVIENATGAIQDTKENLQKNVDDLKKMF